jgi:thioredoxin 1
MATQMLRSARELEELIKSGVTLIDFNAPWCGPCRSQEPILDKIAKQFDGRAAVAAMNIDNHQDIVLKLGIQSIPTLVIFKNNKELQRFVGLQPETTLFGALKNLMDES